MNIDQREAICSFLTGGMASTVTSNLTSNTISVVTEEVGSEGTVTGREEEGRNSSIRHETL